MKEDIAVFEEWIGGYSSVMERLAFQYGCSTEQAARLAEKTFRIFYNDAEKMAEGKLFVYQIMLETLGQIEQLAPMLVSPIPFEEDAEFHSRIVKLPASHRVPLILREFHALSVEEIAAVMMIPIGEVEANSQAAKESLKETVESPSADILAKRLEFLGKSYNRLPLLLSVDNVVRKENVPAAKEHKKLGRKGWITAIILGIFLIGLIGSTYFTGEDWELRSDRRYIDGLRKEFAEHAADKQAILGVSEEVFNQIPFITEANIQFTQILMELENKNSKGGKINRQLAEAWLLEQTEAMKLPSELADELFAAPLVNNIEKSMMFAGAYLVKVDAVKYSLYDSFAEDYNKVRDVLKTGTVDAEAILAQPDTYSESTIQAIKALMGQNIELVWHEEASWHNENSEFIAQLRAALHESADSYLTQYEREPFMSYDGLFYSLDDTIGFIKEMEQTVIAAKQSQWIGHSMEGTMINLLEAILQGKTIEEFKNSDGSISEVHRNAWRQLASFGSDSGVGVMMTKIVEEMEASDWQYSEFHSSLKDYRIHEAYSFAARDELEQFGLRPLNEMYEDLTFVLPDSQLDDSVANLYDEFSVAYDRTVLKNVHPLLIVGLFYYANDKGDAAVMWHLMDPASGLSSAEEYTAKEIALLAITDSISFNASMVMDNGGTKTAPIEFNRNGKTYYNVWMTYAEDQVWQVESIVIEEGSL